MTDLLGILTGGLTAGANAVTARNEGRAIKAKNEEADLLRRLAANRQAAQDAQNAEMFGLQKQNILDTIRERNEVKPLTVAAPRNIDPLSPEGIAARLEYERQAPKPVSAPTAQGPVRGTPEYEDMLRREAAARASGGGGERGAQLPGPAIEKMIELDDLIGQAKRASQSLGSAVAQGRNVTGRALGVVPVSNWVRNLVGQGGAEGTGVRAELANISSSIFKMRSGAAVTPQEFSRLEPFLANDDDDESVAMIKLRKLREALADIKRIRLENYQKYGKLGNASAGTPAAATDPDDLDFAIDAVLGRRP